MGYVAINNFNKEVEPMAYVAINFNEEVDEAQEKFEYEFDPEVMDTMIHRFPAGLRGIGDPYIVPRFVAIGPYHHGKEHLMKMEKVKKAAAKYLCSIMDIEPEKVMKDDKFREAVDEAPRKYVDIVEEGTRKHGPAPSFAAMMFYDACFLLLYMVAYFKSQGKDEDYMMNPSMRRFLFSNRDSIENDIMLLENQLPWQVLQALVHFVTEQWGTDLMAIVRMFIEGMGNRFKISGGLGGEPYEWYDNEMNPPHLLALLRHHKTKSKPDSPHDNRRPDVTVKISRVSAMELEEIGIRLTASNTASFSDMGFLQGPLWSNLSLAPLSLSNARASCLVNMAAFEVCTASRYGDDRDRTAVSSYIALLAMFMVREEDVHTLRSNGLVHGPHSNREMLEFFKAVSKHLPDSGSHFAHIMEDISGYKAKRYIWIKLYKWIYNNYKTIIKVAPILGTVIGLYRAVLSLSKNQT